MRSEVPGSEEGGHPRTCKVSKRSWAKMTSSACERPVVTGTFFLNLLHIPGKLILLGPHVLFQDQTEARRGSDSPRPRMAALRLHWSLDLVIWGTLPQESLGTPRAWRVRVVRRQSGLEQRGCPGVVPRWPSGHPRGRWDVGWEAGQTADKTKTPKQSCPNS